MPDGYCLRPAAAVTLVLALASAAPAAEVKLGVPFSDHMVVQRDRPLRVWGQASPGAGVDVRLGPRRAATTAGPDGRWTATLSPLPAGGPQVLSATAGGATTEISDVLVGDVWLCSGQSNMQMTLKECDGGPTAADTAGRLTSLRLCSVGRRASPVPEASAEIRWRAASPESARDFSAVGIYFAAALLADPALKDIPVGVVDSSFGGTRCEAWVPKEALAGFAPEELRVSLFGTGPSGLYNAMIAPLGRAPIKGVVWYQGEGNADRPGTYPSARRESVYFVGTLGGKLGARPLSFIAESHSYRFQPDSTVQLFKSIDPGAHSHYTTTLPSQFLPITVPS